MLDLSRAFRGLLEDAHLPADLLTKTRKFCWTKVPDRTAFFRTPPWRQTGKGAMGNAKTASE
jgi:hypothetical protein